MVLLLDIDGPDVMRGPMEVLDGEPLLAEVAGEAELLKKLDALDDGVAIGQVAMPEVLQAGLMQGALDEFIDESRDTMFEVVAVHKFIVAQNGRIYRLIRVAG